MRTMILTGITMVCLTVMARYAGAAGPADPASGTEAYLKVDTGVEEINDGGYLWVRGIPYTIFSADGKKRKWVRNDSGRALVKMPPGKYMIVPDEASKGQSRGADIEQGKLTEVHLMGGA